MCVLKSTDVVLKSFSLLTCVAEFVTKFKGLVPVGAKLPWNNSPSDLKNEMEGVKVNKRC